MGCDEIVLGIEAETAAEVERLLGDADRQAAVIVESASATVRARIDAAVTRAEPGVRAEAGRRVNEARLRANERRVELTLARTAAVGRVATARLAAVAGGADPPRWAAAVARLTSEGLRLAGVGAAVRVREQDVPLAAGSAAELGARVEPMAGTVAPGVTVISADERLEVDATIPVRLARAQVRLAEEIAADLGLGG